MINVKENGTRNVEVCIYSVKSTELWPCRNAPYFSIEVHHGGSFALRPTKVYIGGKVQTVHGLSTEYISLLQLEAMAQQLGYDSSVTFYYNISGYNLDVGLLPINNDNGVLAMLKYMDQKRTVVMYLEQVGGVDSSSIKAHDIDQKIPPTCGSSGIKAAYYSNPTMSPNSHFKLMM
ncbi:hypothetical protein Vadar_029815 [Vaccinium darrowii]|uniref:Uncharacterized protein n=1 Tax=Vaccinium darrowii TaxID=229202 RepID=A0ACB7ZFD7_9ERIC|nr:hypothetical protein Vadar_029815 [Vaccinium darrowii]